MDSLQRPARSIGRYALFAEIASGGMASVHIGRLLGPVGFSRTVAIKRLHPEFARDPEFVTMFLDEARLAARIRHPNVAPTLDVVATHGELFLVMEYIQGESLAQLMRASAEAGKSVPHDIVLAIMSGILHGLHAAHEAKSERGEPLGIVHRDVSPQNILVGTDGVARLVDFGVAKAVGRAHVTRDRHVKGKLSYMAPEQVQNCAVDRRVDVYAAAVVLWELLTGRRLFLADTDSSTLARVLTSVVASPSSIAPGVPAKLDKVVMRGTKRDPNTRFATAREMAIELEECGRLATASAVGDWVENVARAALAVRAAHISAVEQIDDLPSNAIGSRLPTAGTDGASNEIPTLVAPMSASDLFDDTRAEVGPIPLEDSHDSDTAGMSERNATGQRRRRILAATGLFVVLAFCLAWIASNRHSTFAAPREMPSISSASPSTSSQLQAQETIPSLQSAAQPIPANSVGLREPSDQAGTFDQPNIDKIPTSLPQTGSARPKTKPIDCNPPYFIDATGIRHYKRECL